jgi:hypothetical protein
MAHYGNILSVVNSRLDTKNKVQTILKEEKVTFLIFNKLFFFESTSKLNTRNILKKLNQLNIEYIFYHNHISDGSKIKSKNVNSEIVNQIENIMLQ